MVSAEDVAWADSCLIKDPDMSDGGWNSFREALLETLSAPHHSSAYEKADSLEGAKMEISSSEDTGDTRNLDKTTNIAASRKGGEPNVDDRLTPENTDDFWSSHKMEDVFLPTYDENSRHLGMSDPEVDSVFLPFELEQSTADIFKTWDLDIPPEEYDLIKQMNKILGESSLEPTPSVPDDSKALEGLQDEVLDDLISGIADLTLRPNSG